MIATQNFRERLAKAGLIGPVEEALILPERKWFPTENLPLDWVIGKGMPMGAMWELFGRPASCKSTLALSMAAHLQHTLDATVVLYETEQALDDSMLARTQLDLRKTIRVPEEFTDCIASVVNHMVSMAQVFGEQQKAGDSEGVPVILIWDSVAATPTEPTGDALKNKRGTYEAGVSVDKMAHLASQLTVALPHIRRTLRGTDITAIFINQVRQVMNASWGNPVHTPGGMAFEHSADVRTQVSQANPHKGFMSGKKEFLKGDDILGTVTTIEAVKNKLAAPFKRAALINWFASGIDNAYSSILHAIFDLADYEIISPLVKARCNYNDRSWYPQELAKAFRNDRAMWDEFAEKVRAAQMDKDIPITPTVAAFNDVATGQEADEDGED